MFEADGLTVNTVHKTRPGRYSARWWIATAASRHVAGSDVVLSVSAGGTAMSWVRRGPGYLFQAHGTAVSELTGVVRSRSRLWWLKALRYGYWALIDCLTYRQVDSVVAVSTGIATSLERWPYKRALRGTSVLTIPNGVASQRFAVSPDGRQAARRRFAISDDRRVVVCISRLVRQKGVDRCVEALRFSDEDITLLVVGSGPEEVSLHARAAETGVANRVCFAGRIPHSDVSIALACADAFAFPVRAFQREGLPIAVLEALASGMSVLVPSQSQWPKNLESVVDHVPVGDPRALGEAFNGVMPATHESKLPHAYDMATVANDYLAAIQAIVRHRASNL